jgi:hypothetical protein
VLLTAALAALACLAALPPPAAAFTEPGFTGAFTDFAACQANLPDLGGCLHSYITGGLIQIAHATVPISLPGDTLDLGIYPSSNRKPACEAIDVLDDAGEEGCVTSGRHGILNGPAQPVPGGLLGSLGGGQLTAVQAKLEWAPPVPPDSVFGIYGAFSFPDAGFNEAALTVPEGTALEMPVKLHLISPFLGPDCYIGSAADPVTLSLTTATTSPPLPNTPISGTPPYLTTMVAGEILLMTGMVLVDDSFSAPAATGCGFSGGGLLDAAIDQRLGLPSPAGENTIVIDAEADVTAAAALLEHGWSEEWGEPAAQQPAAPEPEPRTPPAEPSSTLTPPGPLLATAAPLLSAPLLPTPLQSKSASPALTAHRHPSCHAKSHLRHARAKRCKAHRAASPHATYTHPDRPGR